MDQRRDQDVAGSAQPKSVTVLMGSPHKGGATLTAARTFLAHLESWGDVHGEIVVLSEYDIRMCRGCKACFDYGEERCPLADDRDVLLQKMAESDGVVFAVPNYSWHVPGVMKVFLDRIGFAFHRPCFHGKIATSIVVQGIGFGGRIRKYLEFVATGLGFTVVKGSVSRTLLPMSEQALRQMDTNLVEQSRRFHAQLLRPAFPTPSLYSLMIFRMGRTGIRLNAPQDKRDYAHYRDRGWFASDYFYPTRLGPLKKGAGVFFDWVGAHVTAFKVAKKPASGTASQP